MASGMIIPSGKTYFDVEILVKAPIPISPANVILNMLEIDDSHNPEEQVMQYFIIQNFTSEKGNIFGERWRPKDERKLLNGSMQQQVYVHVILYGILQDNKNLKLFLDTLKDSLSTEISDPNIRVYMKTELKPGNVNEDEATKIGDSYHGIIVGEQDVGQLSVAGVIEWITEQHLIPDGGLPPWLASTAGEEPTPGAQEN